MSKILSYMLVPALLLLSVACDPLEQESQLSITNENAIVDATTAEAALNGLYDGLQDLGYYGRDFVLVNDLAADNAIFSGFFNEYDDVDDNIIPTSNPVARDVWLAVYETINIANSIIALVPPLEEGPGLDATRKAEILAAAYFVRALNIFDLLRLYGEHWDQGSSFGVPMPLQPSNGVETIARASVSANYQQIIDDLGLAIRDLPDSGEKALASKGAAQALLARVYLYQENYAQAASLATQVIDNPNYSLVADYADIYLTDFSSESIFELDFNAQDGSGFNNFLVRRDEVVVDQDLFDSFDPADLRRDISILPDPIQTAILRSAKYEDASTDSDNAYIIRLAEIYLIRAEARAMEGDLAGGLADLNMTRLRAGLPALTSAEVADAAAFMPALLDERRFELNFEGHRFFDLVRTGNAMSIGVDQTNSIFPIPLREININPELTQNPGYN